MGTYNYPPYKRRRRKKTVKLSTKYLVEDHGNNAYKGNNKLGMYVFDSYDSAYKKLQALKSKNPSSISVTIDKLSLDNGLIKKSKTIKTYTGKHHYKY